MLLICLCLLPLIAGSSLQLDLEYSVDDFTTSYPLGKIALRSSYDGNFTGIFTADPASNQLGTHLSKRTSELYRVRVSNPSSKNPSKYFLTSTDPCHILRSKLMHYIWVALDSDSLELSSVTIFPDNLMSGAGWSGVGCDPVPENSLVTGVVHVAGVAQLSVPDTASFIEKIEKEKRARQHGAETDNRSFIAKYWMYIVPVVLFMVVSSAMNPEQGGQQ